MKKYFLLFSFFLLSANFFAQEATFDHSLFTGVLQSAVNKNGLVNYQIIKEDKKFNEYLLSISNADISSLDKNEKLTIQIVIAAFVILAGVFVVKKGASIQAATKPGTQPVR